MPLSTASRLWRLSNIIFIGPVGPSAKIFPEYEIFRKCAEDDRIDERSLFGLMDHESATVAGYGLEILIRRKSKRLREAVEKLAARDEGVAMGLGCMVCFSPLGEYAKNRLKAEQSRGSNGLAPVGHG